MVSVTNFGLLDKDIIMDNVTEEKRNYTKRTPEERLAELQEKQNKLQAQVAVEKALENPFYSNLVTLRDRIKNNVSKASVALGTSSISLTFRLRVTSAKLAFLQAEENLQTYIKSEGEAIIATIDERINSLVGSNASEQEITEAYLSLPAMDSFHELETIRNSAQSDYEMLSAQRPGNTNSGIPGEKKKRGRPAKVQTTQS